MSSHLTVIAAASPGTPIKGLNATAALGAETGTATPGGFAALLDGLLGAVMGETPQAGNNQSAIAAALPVTAEATLAAATGAIAVPGTPATPALPAPVEPDLAEPEAPVTAPDAIAVPIDAPLALQPVLAKLIDGLAALRGNLQSGQPPKPADLVTLGAAIDDIAKALGVPLDAMPTPDELAAIATKPVVPGASLETQLTKSLAPLAQTLLAAEPADATPEQAATADATKQLGAKLAALIEGLDSGKLDPQKFAALGLGETAEPIPDLKAAIARLVNAPPVTAAAVASAQVFTPPKLTLPETVLAAKADSRETAPAGPTESKPVLDAPTKLDATPAKEAPKPSDDKPVAAPTAQPAGPDTAPEAPSPGQSTATAPKLDAAVGMRPVIAGYQTSQQQLNLPQLAFEMVRQVSDGNTRFQMRLDPAELGRIDVKLDIDASGKVNAHLTVEKAETLDLMQRDQKGLERALQQAGLDPSKTSLEFSLKQHNFGQQQGQDGQGHKPGFGGAATTGEPEDIAPPINLYRGGLTASGVNILA